MPQHKHNCDESAVMPIGNAREREISKKTARWHKKNTGNLFAVKRLAAVWIPERLSLRRSLQSNSIVANVTNTNVYISSKTVRSLKRASEI